jgi:hypothetical protein
LAWTGSFTNVLPPSAIGFFKVWTNVPFASVGRFSFSSEAETHLSFSPRTSLVPTGSVTLTPNAAGGTDYTFQVLNSGADTTAYFAMALVAGYADGVINDVDFSHVIGSSVTQCGVTTDTAIASGASALIDWSFTRPVNSIGRLALEWDEVGVSPSVFFGTVTGGSGTANVFSQCPWTATSNNTWITATSYTTPNLQTTTRYWVRVSNTAGFANSSTATLTVTATFTDPVLTAGVSPVKRIHILELRTRVDAARSRAGLAAFSWTDSITAGVTPIKAAHIAELRSALAAVYQSAGRTQPSYTDPTLIPGVTTMKVAHLQELRNAVIAIE